MNIFFLTFRFIWFSWSHNSNYRFVRNVIIGCPSFPYALHLFFLHPEKKINSTLIIAQTIIYIIQEYHFLVQQKTLVRRTPFKEQCHILKFFLSSNFIFFFNFILTNYVRIVLCIRICFSLHTLPCSKCNSKLYKWIKG